MVNIWIHSAEIHLFISVSFETNEKKTCLCTTISLDLSFTFHSLTMTIQQFCSSPPYYFVCFCLIVGKCAVDSQIKKSDAQIRNGIRCGKSFFINSKWLVYQNFNEQTSVVEWVRRSQYDKKKLNSQKNLCHILYQKNRITILGNEWIDWEWD